MLRCWYGVQSVPGNYPQHHYNLTTSKAGWIAYLICFCTKFWFLLSKCCSRLIRPDYIFPVFGYVLISSFISGSGTHCGLLLLKCICFKSRCTVHLNMVFCIPWLYEEISPLDLLHSQHPVMIPRWSLIHPVTHSVSDIHTLTCD